jgi:hypothetical protein
MTTAVRPASSFASASCTSHSVSGSTLGRRLVHDEHGRVVRQRARERQELALPGREVRAALTDLGVVAAHALDELVGVDVARRRSTGPRRCPACPSVTLSSDRAAEQEDVLQHDGDPAAGAPRVPVADVDAVDEDTPALRHVEPIEELDDRRLARAGRADERHLLAGRDPERNIAEHPFGSRPSGVL